MYLYLCVRVCQCVCERVCGGLGFPRWWTSKGMKGCVGSKLNVMSLSWHLCVCVWCLSVCVF